MKRGIILRSAVLAIVALLAFLFLYSFSTSKHPASKESIDECCQKKCKIQDDDLMLESFSRQLISISN
ncbi:MAG: hypothetical protein ACHQF0_12915 [Chitinophagales bacterium]